LVDAGKLSPLTLILQALRYMRPPDSLLTQLNVYTEEKTEDEEDLRERVKNTLKRDAEQNPVESESETLLHDILAVVENEEKLPSLIVETLERLKDLLFRDTDRYI
jgi:diaphanous 1